MPPSSIPTSRRPYFRTTTAAQRRLLFETYEATGQVTEACQRAHVGRGTFYYWWPRFDVGGYAALERPASHAPQHPRCPPIAAALQAEVLAYKRAHPTAGYATVANALRQAHGWEKIIGATSVRKIVLAARAPSPVPPSAPLPPVVVRAPTPGLTINIDLGFVPAQHLAGTPWGRPDEPDPPALEGANPDATTPPLVLPGFAPPLAPTWPGQVFAQDALYAEQMQAYIAQRTEKRVNRPRRRHAKRQRTPEELALQSDTDTARLHHRTARQRWLEATAAWARARQEHATFLTQWQGLTRTARRAQRTDYATATARWLAARTAYRAAQVERTAANTAWRVARQQLHARAAQLPPPPSPLFAFLMVVDNCSRRLLCLPIFAAGKNVTAEMVVAALRPALPTTVRFVISDNGSQFIAEPFSALAQDRHFLQVRIAPRRPCTNGIAERHVQTVKAWLTTQTWNSIQDLEECLADFLRFYNDRPHQGEGLDRFSPNEFERRFAQCSTS